MFFICLMVTVLCFLFEFSFLPTSRERASGKEKELFIIFLQLLPSRRTFHGRHNVELRNNFSLPVGQIRILIHSGSRRRELIFRDLPSNNMR